MHSISSRYRKPKGRSSKRRLAASQNAKKRYLCASNTLTEELDSHSAKENVNTSTVLNKSVFCHQNECTEVENVTESSICTQSPKYTFVDDSAWSALLHKVPCSECNSVECLNVITHNSFGYSANLELICSACGHSFGNTFSSSRTALSRQFEVNRKLVTAFLSIGKGHAAIETFSMILGIPSMDRKTFSNCLDNLCDINKSVKDEVLKASRDFVRKAHLDLDPSLKVSDIINITVSYDGTWQKRGHTSLYGIGAVIDTITGLVVDYEILSKFCHECVATARDLGQESAEYFIWKEGHQSNCQKNFSGSSNSMEMCAALTIWKRSVEQTNMRYTTILSDGDAKTYNYLNENCVYGPDIIIHKEECINHVAKRLGTGLRNKVKEWRGKGITLGGRKCGSLKDETIKKLQNFYRRAIKVNAPDTHKMKASILATLYHCMSSDKKPQHSKCPEGESSWCFFQRALACNEAPKSHKLMKTQLTEDIVAKILPVYQRLVSDELLLRCISAKTQNSNESLHNCIWKKCPKEVFVSKKRLEFAVTAAVSEFNLGCEESQKILSKMNEEEGNLSSLGIAKKRDTRRAIQKEKRSSASYKKKLIKKKLENITSNARKIKQEGVTYAAGSF